MNLDIEGTGTSIDTGPDVGADAAAGTDTTSSGTGSDTDQPGDTAAAAPAPAARKRATRKRAAPKAAPTTGGVEAVAAAPGEPAAAAEPLADDVPAPRKRASRKRAAPKAAPRAVVEEPAGTPDAEPAVADQPDESLPAAAAEAPAEASSPAEVAASVEPPAAEAPAEPPAEAEALAAPVAEEPEPERAQPMIMPLFQPPAPAPRRPRRAASRPAGPPQVSEPAEPAVQTAAPDAAEEEPVAEAIGDAAATAEAAAAAAEGPQADDEEGSGPRRRRRRGGRGRRGRTRAEGEDGDGDGAAADGAGDVAEDDEEAGDAGDAPDAETENGEAGESGEPGGSRRRRRRRRRGSGSGDVEAAADDPPNTITRVREPRGDNVAGVRGSTRLEAKKQRRREGREAGRRRTLLSEAEFLARRESVERVMVVRERDGRTQIGVLEDGVLVEHYVARKTQTATVGNVYLGKVQNVLPSMEAAFVDIGKGRNAVLYAGEVNWDAAGLEGQPRRIEHALKAGESVLVQVTKDPIGHKGARLTSQISLPGRYLVLVPDGSMTGISRKLPDTERNRLKKVLREIVPEDAGVIVRTAAEGASEEELDRDVARLKAQWEDIKRKATSVNAPALLYGEPDLAIRVVRDVFNEDFRKLIVSGEDAWETLSAYLGHVAPDLAPRLEKWDGGADGPDDVFGGYRIEEQLHKALDRKVWLPSGGSLVIDRTEAMTVVDVNTGKFTGAGGNLEETVTRNNLEAAEEVVRQLRLRDIGGIIVVDFIDMVLESNRELVLRRLLECLGRDRTRHQVAEVTSLGLVQMTRKRVGQGLLEVFSETCEVCGGRGVIIHDEPVERRPQDGGRGPGNGGNRSRTGRNRGGPDVKVEVKPEAKAEAG